MKKIVIEGNHSLSGTINIGGAKNSAVALIPAAILSDEFTTIYNVPNISDKVALLEILKNLNCQVLETDDVLNINSSNLKNVLINEELSSKLRASYYFMGALLGKCNHVEICLPGGCNIGARPIDYHLKGFKQLGATITIEDNKYIIDAKELIGSDIYLDFPSVGATINIMLAAVKAKGKTTIFNAAKEPEIVNVATFLNNMGAKITGAGTSEIKIEGVNFLHKGIIEVIPDRIEAATYIIAGALIGDNLKINGVIREHLESLLSKFNEMGIKYKLKDFELTISKCENIKPTSIKSQVFPGFVTDMGQPTSVLLTQCNGISFFEETIYDNRMGHVKYLNNMGANISVKENTEIICGKTKLYGKKVVATDLRAGAAMVLAGLIAQGTTEISQIDHILRGYENIIGKLTDVGAQIKIVA
jgi:UDP-N-acetylglucosamine 1-carboxyvinyltransferase